MDKMPVPQSWRDAVTQQQQLREEGTNYKTINKVNTNLTDLVIGKFDDFLL